MIQKYKIISGILKRPFYVNLLIIKFAYATLVNLRSIGQQPRNSF